MQAITDILIGAGMATLPFHVRRTTFSNLRTQDKKCLVEDIILSYLLSKIRSEFYRFAILIVFLGCNTFIFLNTNCIESVENLMFKALKI